MKQSIKAKKFDIEKKIDGTLVHKSVESLMNFEATKANASGKALLVADHARSVLAKVRFNSDYEFILYSCHVKSCSFFYFNIHIDSIS